MSTRLPSLVVPFLLAALVPAQDQLTKQALQRIEEVEKAEPQLAAGDNAGAQALLAKLDWATRRLNAVYDKKEPHWADAQKRCEAVRAKVDARQKAGGGPAPVGYDAAALAQLDKEVLAAVHNFGLLSRANLRDEYRRKSAERELEQFGKRLTPFPATDAAVQGVAAHLAKYQADFDSMVGQLRADEAAAGDAETRLKELETKYDRAAMPSEPTEPFSPEAIGAWATSLRQLRDVDLPREVGYLEVAAGNAALDAQWVSRLRNWIGGNWTNRVDELEQTVRRRLDNDAKAGVEFAEFVLATDPADRDQVVNRILGKGAFDRGMARLVEATGAVAIAKALDEVLPAPSSETADRAMQAAQILRAVQHMKELAISALAEVRMPAAVSTDEELLRIAAETLRRPGYEVGEWQRLVVNAPKVRRQKHEGWVSGSGVSRTITFYDYVWDEYQVATAERRGDEIWIWFNRLKYYHSGDTTKPIGRWVLSERFESTRILPENVDR